MDPRVDDLSCTKLGSHQYNTLPLGPKVVALPNRPPCIDFGPMWAMTGGLMGSRVGHVPRHGLACIEELILESPLRSSSIISCICNRKYFQALQLQNGIQLNYIKGTSDGRCHITLTNFIFLVVHNHESLLEDKQQPIHTLYNAREPNPSFILHHETEHKEPRNFLLTVNLKLQLLSVPH